MHFFSPHACKIPHPSQPSGLDRPDNTLWGVRITQPLITLFSLTFSRYFLPLRDTYASDFCVTRDVYASYCWLDIVVSCRQVIGTFKTACTYIGCNNVSMSSDSREYVHRQTAHIGQATCVKYLTTVDFKFLCIVRVIYQSLKLNQQMHKRVCKYMLSPLYMFRQTNRHLQGVYIKNHKHWLHPVTLWFRVQRPSHVKVDDVSLQPKSLQGRQLNTEDSDPLY
jgi:hypothetical protein